MARLWEQLTFKRGEVSPSFFGRSDLEVYKGAVSEATNCVYTPTGSLRKRNGLRAVADATAENSVLIPFKFNIVDVYLLEFTNERVKVWRETSRDVFEEQTSVSAPWLEADLPRLSYVQNRDVLYIVHTAYLPRALVRVSHTNWVISIDLQPFWFTNSRIPGYSSVSGGAVHNNDNQLVFTGEETLTEPDPPDPMEEEETTTTITIDHDLVNFKVGGVLVPTNSASNNRPYYYDPDTATWAQYGPSNASTVTPYWGSDITDDSRYIFMIGNSGTNERIVRANSVDGTWVTQQTAFPGNIVTGIHLYDTSTYAICENTQKRIYKYENGSWDSGTSFSSSVDSQSLSAIPPGLTNAGDYIIIDNKTGAILRHDSSTNTWVNVITITNPAPASARWAGIDCISNTRFILCDNIGGRIYDTDDYNGSTNTWSTTLATPSGVTATDVSYIATAPSGKIWHTSVDVPSAVSSTLSGVTMVYQEPDGSVTTDIEVGDFFLGTDGTNRWPYLYDSSTETWSERGTGGTSVYNPGARGGIDIHPDGTFLYVLTRQSSTTRINKSPMDTPNTWTETHLDNLPDTDPRGLHCYNDTSFAFAGGANHKAYKYENGSWDAGIDFPAGTTVKCFSVIPTGYDNSGNYVFLDDASSTIKEYDHTTSTWSDGTTFDFLIGPEWVGMKAVSDTRFILLDATTGAVYDTNNYVDRQEERVVEDTETVVIGYEWSSTLPLTDTYQNQVSGITMVYNTPASSVTSDIEVGDMFIGSSTTGSANPNPTRWPIFYDASAGTFARQGSGNNTVYNPGTQRGIDIHPDATFLYVLTIRNGTTRINRRPIDSPNTWNETYLDNLPDSSPSGLHCYSDTSFAFSGNTNRKFYKYENGSWDAGIDYPAGVAVRCFSVIPVATPAYPNEGNYVFLDDNTGEIQEYDHSTSTWSTVMTITTPSLDDTFWLGMKAVSGDRFILLDRDTNTIYDTDNYVAITEEIEEDVEIVETGANFTETATMRVLVDGRPITGIHRFTVRPSTAPPVSTYKI